MKKIQCQFFITFILLLHSAFVFSYNEKSLEKLLHIKEKDIDLAEVALGLTKEIRPRLNIKKYMASINKMVFQIKHLMKRDSDPKSKIKILNDYFYKRFSYDLDDPMVLKEKNRFLTGLIDSRKGSCITLPLLYVTLAQQLGLPMYPVLAPSHIFVRYIGDISINIETTTNGRMISDEKYIEDFLIPPQSISSGAYMKRLTYKEYLSELIMVNAIEHFFRRNKIKKGLKYIDLAIKIRPSTPELYQVKGKMNSALYNKYQRVGELIKSNNYLSILNKMRWEVKRRGYVHLRKEKYLKKIQKQKGRQRI